MFYLIIVLYGLSLIEAYNIKLTGQVELGKQLSKLFREAYFGLGGSTVSPSEADKVKSEKDKIEFDFGVANPFGIADPEGNTSEKPTPHRHKKNEKCSQEQSSHVSVLDEMVQNEQQNLHLYGNHKLEKQNGKGDGPLNNIHL